jgi:26S proteasome regulatory subunit N2
VILLTDTKPSEPKTLLEMKAKKTAPAATPGAAGPSGDQASEAAPAGPAPDSVNANQVDEGDEEAPMPGEFEYHSDGGDGDEE